MRDEVREDIKRLRLQGHGHASPPYLEQRRVELDIPTEPKHHMSTMPGQPFCVTQSSAAGVRVPWAFRYAANVSWSVLLRTGFV